MRLPLVHLSVLGTEGGCMWHRLGAARAELRLHATLANGQAFTWSRVGSDAKSPWVGVVGGRVIVLKEEDSHVEFCCPSAPEESPDALREALTAYFQLETPLVELYERWRSADERTCAVLNALPGLRILRQEPVECLFSFICSSNNNIGRITGILARLRAAYGTRIPIRDASIFGAASGDGADVPSFFAFPTIERLAQVPEAELRELGLGYRARFIRETASLLLERGGADWLVEQRGRPREDVQAALVELSGVGRKVADCVALFSLDQPATIPVDVHVWQIACRDYDPSLHEAKSLTPAVYGRVGDLFRARFGAHAGWAHSVLFAAELPVFRALLPDVLQERMVAFRLVEREKSAQKKEEQRQRAVHKALGDATRSPAAADAQPSGRAASPTTPDEAAVVALRAPASSRSRTRPAARPAPGGEADGARPHAARKRARRGLVLEGSAFENDS